MPVSAIWRPRTGNPYADWPSLDAAAQSFGGLVHANDGLVTPAIATFPGYVDGPWGGIRHSQRSSIRQRSVFGCGHVHAMLAFQKSAVAQYGFTGKPNPAGLQRATLYPFDHFPPG